MDFSIGGEFAISHHKINLPQLLSHQNRFYIVHFQT